MTVDLLERLRNLAISHSLFCPTNLKVAFQRLKFVQADPIRCPARAQDLILRQRVEDYRAGDLERYYPSLDLEEEFLYAYGFVTRDLRELVYPRKTSELSQFEEKVLESVKKSDDLHPRELEAEFGRERVVNAWGGFSQATKKALEHLHYCGFVRVTRREKGIRVYGAASAPPSPPVPVSERLKKLIMVTANIFAPVTDRCLQEALSYLRRTLHEPPHTKTVISDLIKSGELQKESVDGIDYLYPSLVNLSRDEVPSRVQFLAPFDPLVWDRRRFEHFWGWAYRFEAYTPPQKRLRGYYAMPMLWGDQMVGWANVTTKNGVLDVEVGFAEKKQTGSDFRADLEKEIGRMETFLKPKE